MKRLRISFLAAEIDFDMSAADIGDVTVDLIIEQTPMGKTVSLDNFLCCGERMKQWVIDHNLDDLYEFILQEVDYDAHEDGENIKIGGGKYEIHLLFGKPTQSYETFRFDTQLEADTFMEGVEAVNGWSRALLPEDADEEDLDSLSIENEGDFKRLRRYLEAAKEVGS